MFIPTESMSSPQVVTDASATVGCHFDTHWLAGPWPEEILAIPGFTESSALFKIYPLVPAAQVWVVFGQVKLASSPLTIKLLWRLLTKADLGH